MLELGRLVPAQSAVAALLQVTQMVCSIVVLRWVSPAENGVWQSIVLLESYFGVVRLGVINSFNRQFPFLSGRGERSQAEATAQAAEAYTLLACGVEVVGLLIVCLYAGAAHWRAAAIAMALYGPAMLYRTYLEATCRSGREFSILARNQGWLILAQVLSIPLVWVAGFDGYLGRTVAIAVGGTLLLHRMRPVRLPPRWDWTVVGMLVTTGMPLFISNYGTVVASTFGRMLLLQRGGEHELGLFTPVSAIFTLGVMAPSIISTYLLPRLNFDLGQTDNAMAVADNSWRVGLACVVFMLPFVAAGWWLIPICVGRILPAYVESVPAMRWGLLLVLAGCFKIATLPLSVLQAWPQLFAYVGAVLATNYLCPALLLHATSLRALEAVTVGLVIAAVVQIMAAALCVRSAVARYRPEAPAPS